MNVNQHVAIPASKISQKITMNVHVTGMKGFRVRWWVAIRLLSLAAWIAGCGLHVDVDIKS